MHFRLAHDIVLLVYSVSISFSCILVRLVSLPVALEQYDYDNPALSPIVCSRRKNSLRMTARLAVRRLDLTDATVKFLRRDHMPTFPLHTALIRPRISSANSIAGTASHAQVSFVFAILDCSRHLLCCDLRYLTLYFETYIDCRLSGTK